MKRPPEGRAIGNGNEIGTYLHCRTCLATLPAGVSPREWTRYEVGFTTIGLQVWCRRCETNIIHIDFEGQQHTANGTAAKRD